MKRMLLVTLFIFVFSMLICGLTMAGVHRFTGRARILRSEAILAMDAGDVQAVEESLSMLANYLDENMPWLEIVCDHEDLHTIKGDVIDAQVSVEFGIEDDFYQAISRFGEAIEHIAGVEKLSFSNIC